MSQPWKQLPPWVEVELPKTSCRTLYSVINELDVEKALRYRPKAGATYCNIFVWDVTKALGVEIPHWYDPKTGQACEPGPRTKEMTANLMARWLHTFGPTFGWAELDKNEALDAAAADRLVLAVWDSGSKGPGHVAVVLPEGTIAQAGAQNFVGKTLSAGFGDRPVKFYATECKVSDAVQS